VCGRYVGSNGVTEVGAVLAMGVEFAQFINEVGANLVYLSSAFSSVVAVVFILLDRSLWVPCAFV